MQSKHSNGFVQTISISPQIRTYAHRIAGIFSSQMSLLRLPLSIRIVYTCSLNNRGGVEAHFTATILQSGDGCIVNPKFKVRQKRFEFTSQMHQ